MCCSVFVASVFLDFAVWFCYGLLALCFMGSAAGHARIYRMVIACPRSGQTWPLTGHVLSKRLRANQHLELACGNGRKTMLAFLDFFDTIMLGGQGGFAPFLLGCFGAVGGVGGVSVNVRVHLVSMLMLREGRLRGWGWGWGWGGGVGPW